MTTTREGHGCIGWRCAVTWLSAPSLWRCPMNGDRLSRSTAAWSRSLIQMPRPGTVSARRTRSLTASPRHLLPMRRRSRSIRPITIAQRHRTRLATCAGGAQAPVGTRPSSVMSTCGDGRGPDAYGAIRACDHTPCVPPQTSSKTGSMVGVSAPGHVRPSGRSTRYRHVQRVDHLHHRLMRRHVVLAPDAPTDRTRSRPGSRSGSL